MSYLGSWRAAGKAALRWVGSSAVCGGITIGMVLSYFHQSSKPGRCPLGDLSNRNMSELLAFTADHVCRLTRLSAGQLRYWDKTEFFSPTLLGDHARRTFGRIYSFRDVVGLRTIAILRKNHQVSLQELRRVGAWLHDRHDEPWASLRFALAGKKVVFMDPEHDVAIEPRGEGQRMLNIALEPIASEMRVAAGELRGRSADEFGRIVRNRYVVHNAWVIAGTRVPTEAIWNFHKAGYDTNSIIAEYPRLTAADIDAAIAFQAKRQRAA